MRQVEFIEDLKKGGGRIGRDEVKNLNAEHAAKALLALTDDCATSQGTILQWASTRILARGGDNKLGHRRHDVLGGITPARHLRHKVDLRKASVQKPDLALADNQLANLSEINAPENMGILHRFGTAPVEQKMSASDFSFNLNLTRACVGNMSRLIP